MTNPNSVSIPLSSLSRSKANVRSTKDAAAKAAQDELVASIEAHGLLQSLSVIEGGAGGRFAVVAGARRLAALKELAKAGKIATDYPVPCIVVDADSATETSLAENTVRVAMHPADQVTAFAKLAKAGASPDQIAARFGVARRTVDKRLRLGGLAGPILTAWRAGELNEDAVIALASTPDDKQSRRIFDQLRQTNGNVEGWQVRRILNEGGAMQGDNKLAVFVGPDAYREAGGHIEENLFADGPESMRFQDADLVARLAQDKLDALAKAAAADGWRWTETYTDLHWQDRNRYDQHRIDAEPEPYTTEEAAEVEQIEQRMGELEVQAESDDCTDADQHRLYTEQQELEERYAAIEEARDRRVTFSDDDKARSGCVFYVEQGGELIVMAGCLSADDAKAERKAAQKAQRAAARAAAGEDGPEVPDGPPPYSDALRGDLRAVRGACVARALAEDPRLATDLIGFTLARKGRFGFLSYESGHVLDITIPPKSRNVTDKLRESDLAANVLEPHVPVAVKEDAGWNQGSIPEALATFLALPEHLRNQTLAVAVADLLVDALADDEDGDAFELLVKRMGVDFRERLAELEAAPWSPDLLFNRMTKPQIMEAAKALGDDWLLDHAKAKKGELAQAAADAFAKRPAWAPTGF